MSEILEQVALPDIQNDPQLPDSCANVPIQKVGFSNICVPGSFISPKGERIHLETSFSVYGSLDADRRGLNMSRIPITIHRFCHKPINYGSLDLLAKELKKLLDVKKVYLALSFRYPMIQASMKTNMKGIQYYDAFLQVILDEHDVTYHFMGVDFLYSSSCPCSYALSVHSRKYDHQDGIAHSQRSIAKLFLYVDKLMAIYDAIMLCRQALHTETQVIVKREDEQAFALANAFHQKFVEDATRQLYGTLINRPMIKAFRVNCVHQESLHSYDAVADISYGKFPF